MSIFLSIKVWLWHNTAYKNYGENNPYDVMSDIEFTRLEVRDSHEEIDKERIVYIPIALWYGTKAKVIYYLYYMAYDEKGEIVNGTSGVDTMDLELKDFKWQIKNIDGWY